MTDYGGGWRLRSPPQCGLACRTVAEGFLHSYDIIRSAEQITCASPVLARSPHPDSMATWSSVTFDSPVRVS